MFVFLVKVSNIEESNSILALGACLDLLSDTKALITSTNSYESSIAWSKMDAKKYMYWNTWQSPCKVFLAIIFCSSILVFSLTISIVFAGRVTNFFKISFAQLKIVLIIKFGYLAISSTKMDSRMFCLPDYACLTNF